MAEFEKKWNVFTVGHGRQSLSSQVSLSLSSSSSIVWILLILSVFEHRMDGYLAPEVIFPQPEIQPLTVHWDSNQPTTIPRPYLPDWIANVVGCCF